MWRDEGTTYVHAGQHSIAAVLQSVLKGELSPPLYFLVEHFWVQFAGTSEFSLRLPSLFATAAAVGLLYDTARRVCGRVAGYATAACAFMTPLWLFVGTEARPYAMTMLLATLVLWLVALLVDERRDAARTAVALAVTVSALCWTHYTAWPVVVALVLASPVIGFGKPSRQKVSYLIAVLAGGATTMSLIREFIFAARGSLNIEPDPIGADLFHRIDARFVWFNPLVIAEPVFVAIFFVGTAIWLLRVARFWRTAGLTTETQLLIVCFSIVICGVSASVIRSAPTYHHLAAYAPAAWLILGIFYARTAAWLGAWSDLRKLSLSRRVALTTLCATTMLTLFTFPLTYLYARAPRSGSLPLVRELRLLAGHNVMLISAPDAVSPSLKYYLDADPTARLQGIPTWSQPWYYGYVREVDASQKQVLRDRIDGEIKRCTAIAFAVDWNWKSFNGISYDVVHDIVSEESRLHGVAFHKAYPGTIETMDLVVLASPCRSGGSRHPIGAISVRASAASYARQPPGALSH